MKFSKHGTVLNVNKGHSGRPRSVNTPDQAGLVDQHFEENPTTSNRRASLELNISRTSLQRIQKKLKLWPYKIQIHQELTQYDMDRRVQQTFRINRFIELGKMDVNKIWFSDEAHFTLAGYVNKQNHRFWAKEQPHIIETARMKPKRTTVWCALCADGIIGPFFFDENVNSERYTEMLENEFIPLAQATDRVEGYWFMQDGARPHRTNQVFEVLDEHFHGRVLGLGYEEKGSGLDWPPYSPDMNPCDFFLWGYLKEQVYRSAPRTIAELQERVRIEIGKISRATLSEVARSFQDRLKAVDEAEGGHIEQYVH